MPIIQEEMKLNQNLITACLFNMIISQRVFDSKVASTSLADKFRVDGTLFGDTKLYHSFDIGSPEDWLDDAEATDLLKLNRNKSGKTQSITMGVYKIISITVDQYLSKQAFMLEGTFAEYTSFLTGSLRKIKRVYDRSLINNKLGTLKPSTSRCDISIVTPRGATIEETRRLEAQTIASKLEVLVADLEDNNRDFNAFGYLRSYDPNDFIAVWNVEFSSKITKLDLPTIFHKDINVNGGFEQHKLPARWFGNQATEDLTLELAEPDNVTKRISESGWYDVVNDTDIVQVHKPTKDTVFLWAGDPVPFKGQVYVDNVRQVTVTVASTTLPKEYYYVVDPTIAFVLIHKEALPFMSGFETGTEFWNSRSLTTNHYLIFGHNNLEYLEEYPRMRFKVTLEPESEPSEPEQTEDENEEVVNG